MKRVTTPTYCETQEKGSGMKVSSIGRIGRQGVIAVSSFMAGGALMIGATALASSDPAPSDASSGSTSTTTSSIAVPRVAAPDCTRAPFRGANYDGCDLRGASFDRVELTNASFRHANLDGALFREIVLSHVDFTGASLVGARFEGVTFNSSTFDGSSLSQAIVEGGYGGDGLSTGLPTWETPQHIVVTTEDGQIDLSTDITGVRPIVAKRPVTPMCHIPLVGDGYTTDPVHLTDCPDAPVQWGWEFIWGGDQSLDDLRVLNLSHEDQVAHLPLVVEDGFGRKRSIDAEVHIGDITVFDVGEEPGEFCVYGL